MTNPGATLSDIEFKSLTFLYLGYRSDLDGREVTLAEYAPLRGAFYLGLAGMSESRVDRHWISMVFRGTDADPPRRLDDVSAVAEFVRDDTLAIAFLPVGETGDLKVLTVDGHAPGEREYPLRTGSIR